MWYLSPLCLDIQHVSTPNFRTWVIDRLQVYNVREWWEMFLMLYWSVWLGRNDCVFDGVERDIMGSIGKAQSIIEEYKKVVALETKNRDVGVEVPAKWVAPSGEGLKLNIDATFSEGG